VVFELNQEQKEAAEALEKPLIIVAGAGTGKTRTLTARLAAMADKGPAGRRLLALTFTNKAAKEMAERIMRIKPGFNPGRDFHGHFIGTFHSLCAKILRRESRLAGRTANFAIFDDHDSFALIKRIVKNTPGKKPEAGKTPAAMRDKISRFKNGMEEKIDLTAEKIFKKYEDGLMASNAFDFDDLILKTVELFRKNPDVLKIYQKKFSHILVDEYQDINAVQYELIKLLVGGAGKLSAVGDAEQTIYTWRGSDIGIFLNFKNDWPDSSVKYLTENYRSTKNIIRAAGALIKNNDQRLYEEGKDLWTKNSEGEPIKIFEAQDDDSEAEWIAEQIQRSGVKGQNEGGTAILYRTNAQSRAIEQALITSQIPYRIFGGLKFYERKEIKDIVASLRFAMNRKDSVSLERLEKAFRKSVFLSLKEALEGVEKLEPAEIIRIFIEKTDYLNYIKMNFENPEERAENIAELMRFAGEKKDLVSFLEEIALVGATDEPSKKNESKKSAGVNLMTIHLAKGLEFGRVFVVGVSEGILPHTRSYGIASAMEEERRLMYVAVTRAKRELFLSFYDIPSRFLGELPEEVLTFINAPEEKNYFSEFDEERYITLD